MFIEKGLSLLNDDGRLGIICPNKFFTAQYGRPIRQILSGGKHLSQIVNFGHHQVFENATTYTALLFLDKSTCKELDYTKVLDLESWKTEQGLTVKPVQKKKSRTKKPSSSPDTVVVASETGSIPTKTITDDVWNFSVGKGAALFEKLTGMPVKLGDVADRIFQGLITSADNVFHLDYISETKGAIRLFSRILQEERTFEKGLFYPILSGTDVHGYAPLPSRQYILFPYRVQNEAVQLIPFIELEKSYPRVAEYLLANKKLLSARERGKFKGKDWHQFGRSQNIGIQGRAKLCIPRLVRSLHAGLDATGSFCLDNVDVGGLTIKPEPSSSISLEFLLALLNSKLLSFYFPHISAPFRGGWLSANRQFIEKLPIVVPSTKRERQIANRLVDLVSQMSTVRLARQEALSDSDCKLHDQRAVILDREIDALVYELYGLTEEEIEIAKNA